METKTENARNPSPSKIPLSLTSALNGVIKNYPFTPIQSISQSNRSIVVSTFHKPTNQNLILKLGSEKSYGLMESKCLKNLEHPNIVQMIDAFPYQNHFCIVLEKVNGICLIELLSPDRPFSDQEASLIAKQLVQGLHYLHSKGWAHRDLKPDNIIYNKETGQVKLIDFEFACKHSKWKSHHSQPGTFLYSSPEIRRGSYHGPEVDVWALGVTIYVMIVGYFPFSERSLREFRERPPKIDRFTESCGDFINKVFQLDSKNRATTETLKSHRWINNTNLTNNNSNSNNNNNMSSNNSSQH